MISLRVRPYGARVTQPGPTITVLRYDALAAGGRFVPWLRERGVTANLVRLDQGERVPDVSAVGDGLLLLGGTMSALDQAAHPFLADVRGLVCEVVDRGVPTFGICLGHQLLAHALGGQVEIRAADTAELGAQPLRWTPAALADPVVGGAARKALAEAKGTFGQPVTSVVHQFHEDAVVVPPPGSVVLASTLRHQVQAFRAGSALGVQFHPEATPQDVRDALARVPELTEETIEEIMRATEDLDDEVVVVGHELAAGFADQVWREYRGQARSA